MPLFLYVLNNRRISVYCGYTLLAMSMGLNNSYAGKMAWTQDQVSPGIYTANKAVTVEFIPNINIPVNAQISGLYVNRSYNGNALVETKVCLNTASNCKNMPGTDLNTNYFNQHNANSHILLIHTIKQPASNLAPVFVRSSVTVWFNLPHQGNDGLY